MITKHSGKEWGIVQRSYREKLCRDSRHFKLNKKWTLNVCLFVCLFVCYGPRKFHCNKIKRRKCRTREHNDYHFNTGQFFLSVSIITLCKKLFHLLVYSTETGQFYQIKEWQTARNIIFLKRDNSDWGHQLSNIAFHNLLCDNLKIFCPFNLLYVKNRMKKNEN